MMGWKGPQGSSCPFSRDLGSFWCLSPRWFCHRERRCDLSPVPDRKKQIITQLRERMSKAVLAARGFFPVADLQEQR